jgi:alpha-galactosidase
LPEKIKKQQYQMKIKILIILLSLAWLPTASNAENKNPQSATDSVFYSLAATPPMGWNSWNKFGCSINEKLLMEMADAMVSSGMKDAGYEYIVIDDCWQVDRDKDGNIVADSVHFPNGIKALSDYIHSKGLKLGIYSCAGSLTCQGRPGSRGYQFQDARQYAKWGVDYLKYDWCSNEGQKAEAAYKTMSDALKVCGRPIVFSICEWGESQPWKWGKGIGHLWRITPDIRDCFECKFDWGGVGVLNIIDTMADLYTYAGPGHWNDAEMLEIGNGGMTYDEYITHMSMWSMLAAPLMAGNDLRNMNGETKEILTNKEVIAVNQDKLGQQAIRFMDMGEHEIWAKPLDNNEIAICFMNRTNEEWDLNYDWKKNAMYFATDINVYKNEYSIRDLWKHQNIGTTASLTRQKIPAHGVLMVRLSLKKNTTAVTEIPKSQNLNKFYSKMVDAKGIPVIGSKQVSNMALNTAAGILEAMLSKKEILKALTDRKSYVMIIGANEQTCDMPEYADICSSPDSIAYWNKRARGLGDDTGINRPTASCGEENLLCLPGDRYEGENILVHEFAHIIHTAALAKLYPDFNVNLQKLMDKASAKGLWKNTYATTNKEEYFAECVQSFFNCNRWSSPANGVHGEINRRDKLKNYDSEMYTFLLRFFSEVQLPINNKIQ